MKLSLDITFQTDGDFCFLAKELIQPNDPFYNGAVKFFSVMNEPEEEFFNVVLQCDGDADGCRWAARDVIDALISGGIRTTKTHYWVVERIYNLLVTPREGVLWSKKEDVDYYETMSGNYDGSFISLTIAHASGKETEV